MSISSVPSVRSFIWPPGFPHPSRHTARWPLIVRCGVRPLDGWEAVHHSPTGRWCYFNSATGVVSWDMDGIVSSQERRARSPSPKRLQYDGSGVRAAPPPVTPPQHQATFASRAPGAAPAAGPRGGVMRWASGPAISPDGVPPPSRGTAATAPAGIVTGGPVAARKEQGGLGLALPPDLSASPISSKRPALLPPSPAAPVHTNDETADPGSSGDDTPPVSVGDCCVAVRGAALRSEPSLNSPPMGRLVPANSRVRILEVARCWRFPLPGHPVWRVRVGLMDESAAGANAGGRELLPESLGWISMRTAGGDDILRNETRQQQPDRQESTTASTTIPAQQQQQQQKQQQQQQLTPSRSLQAQPDRSISPIRTQQRVAARMARIDRMAEQKEAEYEWKQVAHQSGKSYWYAMTGNAIRSCA